MPRPSPRKTPKTAPKANASAALRAKAAKKVVKKAVKAVSKKSPGKASKKTSGKAPPRAGQKTAPLPAKTTAKAAPQARKAKALVAPVAPQTPVAAPKGGPPPLKLAAAKARTPEPLKFPTAKTPANAAEKPVEVPAPAPAEPVRSTAHLPRPGETRDAWLARVAHDYYRFLYATALSITRNNDDAEDAVQNAVVNALKRLDQLTEDGAVVSWLAMISRNAALDILRRKKRAPGGGGDATLLPLAAPDKASGYEMAGDMREVLAHAISVLPLSYQEVVNARHFDGLEVEDIAKKFGVTENNVRVRLFRAYEKLRESVQVRKALGLPVEDSAS